MSGIIAAAGIGVAGSLAASQLSKGGSANAAGMSADAAREANRFTQNQRNVNRSDASPWTTTGRYATGTLGGLMGYGYLTGDGTEGGVYNYGGDTGQAYQDALNGIRQYANSSGATLPTYAPVNYLTQVSDSFTADPSYNWRVSEGNKALDRSASSKGMSLSGAQTKALTDYNSNVASTEYENWYKRLLNQSEFNRAANAQNFGQQQTLYQDQYGQWRDALGDYSRMSGMGAQVAGNLASVDSNLTNSGNNALVSGTNAAARYTQEGANALASGISGTADSIATGLAAYGYGNKSGSGYSLPDAARAQLPPYSGYA